MGQSEATPTNQIRRVISVTIDIKDAVERLDPTRHDPQTEYEFNNGRKFKRPQSKTY